MSDIFCPNAIALDLIPTFQKRSAATAIGALLSRENRSRSYQVFLEGVERLHE